MCILFLNEDIAVKKAKITAEGDFSQPSSKHHSFAEVFLVSLIAPAGRNPEGGGTLVTRGYIKESTYS